MCFSYSFYRRSLEEVNTQTPKYDHRRDQPHLTKLVQGVIVRRRGRAVAASGRKLLPFVDAVGESSWNFSRGAAHIETADFFATETMYVTTH